VLGVELLLLLLLLLQVQTLSWQLSLAAAPRLEVA
jgi:hypothetical protein